MAEQNVRKPLLKVEHLSKEFPAEAGMIAGRFSKRVVSAVKDVSFEIYPGETFGLVGESGCGKSTTGRSIMRLTKPTEGSVFFDGQDVAKMSNRELKDMRRNMQFIFQDPQASLNPRMTIGEIISEPMTIHNVGTKEERIDRVRELLDVVGAIRTSSPAVSVSASASPARSLCAPSSSSATSPSRRSTSPFRRRS